MLHKIREISYRCPNRSLKSSFHFAVSVDQRWCWRESHQRLQNIQKREVRTIFPRSRCWNSGILHNTIFGWFLSAPKNIGIVKSVMELLCYRLRLGWVAINGSVRDCSILGNKWNYNCANHAIVPTIDHRVIYLFILFIYLFIYW